MLRKLAPPKAKEAEQIAQTDEKQVENGTPKRPRGSSTAANRKQKNSLASALFPSFKSQGPDQEVDGNEMKLFDQEEEQEDPIEIKDNTKQKAPPSSPKKPAKKSSLMLNFEEKQEEEEEGKEEKNTTPNTKKSPFKSLFDKKNTDAHGVTKTEDQSQKEKKEKQEEEKKQQDSPTANNNNNQSSPVLTKSKDTKKKSKEEAPPRKEEQEDDKNTSSSSSSSFKKKLRSLKPPSDHLPLEIDTKAEAAAAATAAPDGKEEDPKNKKKILSSKSTSSKKVSKKKSSEEDRNQSDGEPAGEPANEKKGTSTNTNTNTSTSTTDQTQVQSRSLSPLRRLQKDPPSNTKATSNLIPRRVLKEVTPSSQPEVHIIGEIMSGRGFGKRGKGGFACKWSIDYGMNWIHVSGDQLGQTQIASVSSESDRDDEVVWCHPIDLHFATSTHHGWPRLLLQVWHLDNFMQANVVGYAFAPIPFEQNNHTFWVKCWRPLGNIQEEMEAWFLGKTTELKSDEVVFNAAWAERCRLKTVATGEIQLNLSILLRNF